MGPSRYGWKLRRPRKSVVPAFCAPICEEVGGREDGGKKDAKHFHLNPPAPPPAARDNGRLAPTHHEKRGQTSHGGGALPARTRRHTYPSVQVRVVQARQVVHDPARHSTYPLPAQSPRRFVTSLGRQRPLARHRGCRRVGGGGVRPQGSSWSPPSRPVRTRERAFAQQDGVRDELVRRVARTT